MATITYLLHDGRRVTLDAPLEQSVMQTAVDNDVAGMDAECGGACACATCHVYVDERFVDRVPAPAEMELQMLDFIAAERRPTSRLACQLPMTSAMDGIVVHVPGRQR